MKKNDILSQISLIKPQISQKLDEIQRSGRLNSKTKSDGTLVTELDLFITDIFFDSFADCEKLNFYSEEKHNDLIFPSIILDPLDGTREFARSIPECSVSFGIYQSPELSDNQNFSWIYNPFNQFECMNDTKIENKKRSSILALVSRSEFEKNLFTEIAGVEIKAVGSIAYKLALLASGHCDIVVTKRPKNIWDIMAGTHLCSRHNIKMFMDGNVVSRLDAQKYLGPIIWTRQEFFEIASKI